MRIIVPQALLGGRQGGRVNRVHQVLSVLTLEEIKHDAYGYFVSNPFYDVLVPWQASHRLANTPGPLK